MSLSTLSQVLREVSSLKKRGIVFIDQGGQEGFLSYHELYQLAVEGLSVLQNHGLKPRDELVFQVEENRAFIILFWSCILGGIVPVPLSVGKNDDQKAKLINVWGILNNPYLISTTDHLDKIAGFSLSIGQEHLVAHIRQNTIDLTEIASAKERGVIYTAQPSDLAFVQFSSGSTGSPKGVMLTHENLITNVAAIAAAAGYTSTDSTFSWMPLTHDMGLIGFHINPLFSKMNQCLMHTNVFVRNPTLWLSKVTEYKNTVICSPNFGYKYLLKHFDEGREYAWDLSYVRIIFNGAEPISEQLGFAFLDALAKFGLRRESMCPVYGLAEASLAVSISKLNEEILSISLDRNQVNIGDHISLSHTENALSFVNLGTSINDVHINIIDDSSQSVTEGVIGHVNIKGKNVTSGYYNNPEANSLAISDAGWLDTGDLGFIKAGELYITGRAKDVFFVNGQNFYPHDLERLAEAVDGVDLNKVIISGIDHVDAESEEVIAFVYNRGDVQSFLPIAQSLKSYLNRQTGVELAHVLPVKDIPKTTSGKLQRFKLVEKYKTGDYNQVIYELAKAKKAFEEADGSNDQPQNETEQALLILWQELFNNTELSVTDRFFEIGGNSLKAAEFVMLLLKNFEVDLPMASLYEKQSVRDLATLFGSLNKVDYQAITRVPETDIHPVSSLQRRLFFFQETNPLSTAYNVPVAFKTGLDIDAELLEKCTGKLIERYDVFRTSFFQEGKELSMQVSKEVTYQVSVLEADFTQAGFFETLINPFDLKKPGLFHLLLIKNGKGETALFFDFHHIIIDGVSVSIFLEELLQLYQGNSLREPGAQYSDFVYWFDSYWKGKDIKTNQQFWLRELSGELPVLEMPTDKARPKHFDHQGQKVAFSISKVKSERLRALSRKYECSMHALMFTAYGLLLHKYTGKSDLIIGIPVTSRNHPDIRKSVGMFVNNLPVRVQIDPGISFHEILNRLNENITRALSHDFPFDMLLEQLEVKRDMSRNPLFDTMFIFQNMALPSAILDAMELQSVLVDPKTSKFDISLEVFDGESGPLTYNIEYSTALFNQETIQRIATHFDTLLDRVLLNPLTQVSDISLLSADSYQDQVFAFNNTHSDYTGKSILDLIETQTTKTPDATALIYDGIEISFATLAKESIAMSQELKSEGLQKADIVGLYAGRSPELVIGILGILRAGAVYLPIDTDLPEKRVQYLLSHSECRYVLTTPEFEHKLSPVTYDGVSVMAINRLGLGQEQPEREYAIDPTDLAYVLYTSGTTGKPKGVKVSHKALHNYVSWAVEKYVDGGKGTFPLFTSVSFDLTLTSIFTPLASGNAIVIYDEDSQDPEHLVIKMLKDNQVDIVKLTPSHLRLLRDADLSQMPEVRLKKMIVGGEALEHNLALDIYKKLGTGFTIFNEYGPTEATVGCMIHKFDPNDNSPAVPIGVPAANTRVYLLDEHLHLVPTGVSGEIYIAGAGLAEGYLYDQERTDANFIPNPFLQGETMYKTGDLSKRRKDGTLEYLGRADEQVKVNGYRIEVDEINYHLRRHATVIDSITLLKDIAGRKTLFSYVITQEESGRIEEPELKTHLAALLPFYMMPTRIILLDEYPFTSNGKVNHKALLEIIPERESTWSKEPVNEVEKIFIHVWKDILDVENITLVDNFFELGGDSIKAVQIVSRLHEKGIVTQARDILTYHTITQLISKEKFEYSIHEVQQGMVSGVKGMTPIESWFFSQQFANPSFYNQSVLLDINQELDIKLLQKTFEMLTYHHDGLRLNYNTEERNLFFNEHHSEVDFSILIMQKEKDLREQLLAIKSGFDLSESLLLRAAVFTVDEQQRHLFITAHHLICDGISWRIFLHDLSKVYASLQRGVKPIFPPKTASLMDWQRQLSAWQPDNKEISEQYWQTVKECSFTLPLDFANQDWSVAGQQQVEVKLNEEYTDFLIKKSHKVFRTDVFTLLNVVLVEALNDWTGERTFVIEHENHGRHLDCDVSRTLGWFTAMYPVRLEHVNCDLNERIKAIKEQIKQVPDHGLSFGLDSQRQTYKDLAKQSEIRFNYLGEFVLDNDDFWSFNSSMSGPETASENHMTTKLEMNAMVMNGVFKLDLNYHEKAFSEKTMLDFGSNFLKKLSQMLDEIKNETDVHFSPSDFSVQLDQQELDELFI